MIKLLKERIHKKNNMDWESLLIYLSYKSTEWSTQTYKHVNDTCTQAGLEIRAGQRTMSGLIVDLTGQTFVLPVILTGQNSMVLKKKYI